MDGGSNVYILGVRLLVGMDLMGWGICSWGVMIFVFCFFLKDIRVILRGERVIGMLF